MTFRLGAAVTFATLGAALAVGVTTPWADPPVDGRQATVYQTVTEHVAGRAYGHSAGYWHLRDSQARRLLREVVLRRGLLARRLAKQTRRLTGALRDAQDGYGVTSDPLARDFLCIHSHEGAWTDPGAPYYGGEQMDSAFMRAYGRVFLDNYGTADHWPAYVQIVVSEIAFYSGRRFGPWPQTSRMCGL